MPPHYERRSYYGSSSRIRDRRRKVVIFDWDDTICPSSFVDHLKVENFKDLPLHYQNLFNEVGKCAEKCLDTAAKYGEVIIITNSDDGWVKFSAQRYVPNLLPVIERFRIVSARTRYERFYPNQPLCWKAAAFAHEVNEIYSEDDSTEIDDSVNTSCESMALTDVSSDSSLSSGEVHNRFENVQPHQMRQSMESVKLLPREVISFGDSMEERTAVKIVSTQLTALPKSVMFITNPTPVQLIGQLSMLTSHMKFVCDHESSLDLEISPEQAQKCAEGYLQKKATDSHCMSPRTRMKSRNSSGSTEVMVTAD